MAQVKEGERKKVMLAVDENECSHYALEWTLNHLKGTISESDLIIFTAQPQSELGYVYASGLGGAPASDIKPVDLIASIQERQKKAASALLEKAKEICANHGIRAETVTESGDPKGAICEAVEKLKIGLLVVGSHSKGAIQRAFLGSVSNYCVLRPDPVYCGEWTPD